jgi:hypothetical protein
MNDSQLGDAYQDEKREQVFDALGALGWKW